MNILFLGRTDSALLEFLREQETSVHSTDKPLDVNSVIHGNFDFLVSYNYHFIIREEILRLFPNAAVNLHISLLPWNRGRDPNFWSFIEGTPKGVTIHFLDEGVDTGDIIAQKELYFSLDETLAETYETLQIEIQKLFKEFWPVMRDKSCPRFKQPTGGSVHKSVDKEPLLYLLTDGWNTPVSILEDFRKLSAKS